MVVFTYDDLLEFAEGKIGKVFGSQFDVIDTYKRRVRLPAREYLLVSRVTKMEAEVHQFKVGSRMVTEYDIPVNGELSEGGDVPWAVLVESGQCDLMLISYMGIDFQNKGERVYRLLNTTLTFYGVAQEGETLEYDIRVTGFAKNMFFFEYDCFVNGKLLIEMRGGCAGFFTDEELAAGKGIVRTVREIKARNAIVPVSKNPLMISPCLNKQTFSEQDMQNLVDRQWGKVLGKPHLDYKLCARKMLMIDRVKHIDPKGGAYGLGLIVGEKILERDHWYFPCHFVGDQVMAGSLVSDGCSQLLKLYMIWLGLDTTMESFVFRPVSGHPNKVRCRGQISPHKGKLVYVMEIKEVGLNPPRCIADVDILDINFEQGQSFDDMSQLEGYGKGDLTKKIVVDFKGIALQMNVVDKKNQREKVFDNFTIDNPAAPSELFWHPMANDKLVPSFSPSKYPPREVCFKPFPGNPLDNNHTPGEMPLTWFNMSEFMCGKVSNCLGKEFQRFDNSSTSRSPAFDLALVTRVVSWDNIEHGKFYNIDCNPSVGTMIGEFDCPKDAWFFFDDKHTIPYSIVMEIALQTSGVLTSVLKAPLTMDKDDILFRNLDAEAEMVDPDVDVRGKTIKNFTKCTGYSMLGNMGIHRFSFELSVEGKVFYKGTTSFGWFIPEVFESQVGLDNGKKRQPWFITENVETEKIDPALVRKVSQLQFFDTINVCDKYAHGQKTVNKNDWFFSCHFWNDPVMPGSLGIESMFQLMESYAIHNNLHKGCEQYSFSHSQGKTSWKYRGQLTPKNDTMDSEIYIKSINQTIDDKIEIIADGFLFVDNLRVYSATSLRLILNLSPSIVKNTIVKNPHTIVRNSNTIVKNPNTIVELGDPGFMKTYNCDFPLYTGAMAKGIASADLVIACGKQRVLASFGAGGLPMDQVRKSLEQIKKELPNGPFAVNLIHSPFDSNLEKGNVDLFIELGVTVVEASAFMALTDEVVRYRVTGFSKDGSIKHRVIAKVSRTELAEMFIRPAPKQILDRLLSQGQITKEQYQVAQHIPMADDITVESDSGGHTDNRPLFVILPLIIQLRDQLHVECGYPDHLKVRVGAAGGIGCPMAALAAFTCGAAFVVTGTVNQLARQSGTSDLVRKQLAKATYSDVTMAPAADMFDQGVELQVLKKGTMFPSKAKKLYQLFCIYPSFEAMPTKEIQKLEKTIFKKSISEVWEETKDFYIQRLKNPEKIQRAEKDSKLKMSLCFRWYLGLSSFWANNGIKDRTMDYQIWCGPAIGSFNQFIKGTYLDVEVSNQYPCVVEINKQIIQGAKFCQQNPNKQYKISK